MVQKVPTTDDVISTVYRWSRAKCPQTVPMHFEIILADGRRIPFPLIDDPLANQSQVDNGAFIPSATQEMILEALDGKAFRTDALAREVGCSRSLLFRKPGGMAELLTEGLVEKHDKLGYYRPDSPPDEITSP